jgi:hypothetical protein
MNVTDKTLTAAQSGERAVYLTCPDGNVTPRPPTPAASARYSETAIKGIDIPARFSPLYE